MLGHLEAPVKRDGRPVSVARTQGIGLETR